MRIHLNKPWSPLEHGGEVRAGRRKQIRPFDPKRAMHLVMRSRQAEGAWGMLKGGNKHGIKAILLQLCRKYRVKLYEFENVGNHLHLVVKFRDRTSLRGFLRVFAQRVMFLVTGARKGSPKGKFFDRIAYTRVVDWGVDFERLKIYLYKNSLETQGFSWSQVRQMYRDALIHAGLA